MLTANQARNLIIIEKDIRCMPYCYDGEEAVFFPVPDFLFNKKTNLNHVGMRIIADDMGIIFSATAPVRLPVLTEAQRNMVLKHIASENFGTVRNKLLLHEDNTLEAYASFPIIDAFLTNWDEDEDLPDDLEHELDTTMEFAHHMLVRSYADLMKKLSDPEEEEARLMRHLSQHKHAAAAAAGEENDEDSAAGSRALDALFASLLSDDDDEENKEGDNAE